MSYQPLARTYRPQSFEELIGQESVVLALQNSINLGRVAPCIILTGVRGIGKTTLARLYAKALNCEKGPTGTPCNVCESCKAITVGCHEDVMEIDGASNTGVDDVRSLQETLGYVPQRSKYKVYIIDEVHMLSQSAFNALLKTLEEPPSHVIFILATTELNKIPETIARSRCPVFYLQRLTNEQIFNRLRNILETENITYDNSSLQIVAREGRGSMRDALTFLDQVIAVGGGKLDFKKLTEMIAYVPSMMFLDFIRDLLARDIAAVLNLIAQWDKKGVSFIANIEEVAKYIRHISIVKSLGKDSLDAKMLDLEPQNFTVMDELAKQVSASQLTALFKRIVDCRNQLDGSFLDRYMVENYVFEWCLEHQTVVGRAAVNTPIIQAPRAVEEQPSSLHVHQLITEPGPMAGVGEVVAPPEVAKQGGTTTAAEVVDVNVTAFPDSWRDLVDRWKRKKPLQARIIEEAKLVKYSLRSIVLAVDSHSLVGAKLLQIDIQRKIKEQFQLMFGFSGELIIEKIGATNTDLRQDNVASRSVHSPANEDLPTTGNAESIGDNVGPQRNALLEQERQMSRDSERELLSQPVYEPSLLEIKQKEKDEQRQRVLTEVTECVTTQQTLKMFRGNIESVEID